MATKAQKPKDRGRKAVAQKAQALQRLTVEYLPITSLKPNPYNPNRQSEHEFELLLASMRDDGFTQPVVGVVLTEELLASPKFEGKGYALGDRVIVDGEHRWRAAQRLGYEEIPIVFVPMTPAQMRVSTLRHNRARGSEDLGLTAEVLRDLRELGSLEWAQEGLMLDDVELNRLLEDTTAAEALAADEFGGAWEPAPRTEEVGLEQDAVEGKDRAVGMTAAAVDRMRAVEQRVKDAKSEEERVAARKDADVYRIVLMFSGDEAAVVREQLGAKPAERVLSWARAMAAGVAGDAPGRNP